ncbi:PLP-dependent aminotransferase family protein [Sulfolobus acidocaldarius]|uniref:Aminotransferase n=4 Tax=Sulfolobus acidocaldarius TaxID=2285 RepID=Q4J8Q1_SULAC|nr:PLP-dependent aminotransferase family protein [Sulfolobus acidocaldarius]AAY80828.1 aminotransferase [Sulfolobus acidocaldarius DSM 639]AGE71428.1 aminotransferase [Sulfolobus acidocaldarius N8]AGE73701.1 aminotransferase [Sulfolobus acidocaldarius Ron12/I]ALU30330.1 aminotransferase [Sulfolobus acidocaldarius]ALU31048.1 aminotransferase [Sulfolobus acidocaldarius]
MFERFLSKDAALLKGSEIRDILKITEGKNVISLAGGLPAPDTFPVEEIKKITQDILDNDPEKGLQYTATAGISEFRRELVNLSNKRGITGINDRNVFATVGSQEALFMIFNLLVDPGDVVIVEMPSYLAALNILRSRKPIFIGVNVKENGLDLDELETKIKKSISEGKKPKLLYVIPTAQNPAGTTMNLSDRKRLLEIAENYDILVVEDDAYGFLVFDGDNPPPLKALDKSGRVIYTSTFSKILAPGFRLGWIVANEEFIKNVEMYKQNVDLHTPSFTQMIAMEAIKRGVIERQIPKIRQIYRHKRDVMLDAINKYFPKDARWSKPVGGMFVFAWLDKKIDTTKMLEEAVKRGVAYVPGASFYYDYSGRNTMRLNFSYPTESDLEKAIQILSSVIKSFS